MVDFWEIALWESQSQFTIYEKKLFSYIYLTVIPLDNNFCPTRRLLQLGMYDPWVQVALNACNIATTLFQYWEIVCEVGPWKAMIDAKWG